MAKAKDKEEVKLVPDVAEELPAKVEDASVTQGVTVEDYVPEGEKKPTPEPVLVQIKDASVPRKPYLSRRTLAEMKRGQEQVRKYSGLAPDGSE